MSVTQVYCDKTAESTIMGVLTGPHSFVLVFLSNFTTKFEKDLSNKLPFRPKSEMLCLLSVQIARRCLEMYTVVARSCSR